MCGRERSYRIGQSGAAGWSKATKPRRHNLIMIAQELLFVNRLFKLPDLLGIGGSLRMGDSMECGGVVEKRVTLLSLVWRNKEASERSPARLTSHRAPLSTLLRGRAPPGAYY